MNQKKIFWIGFGMMIVLIFGFVIYRLYFDFQLKPSFTISKDNQMLSGDGHIYKFFKIANQKLNFEVPFAKTQNGYDIFRVSGHPNEVIVIPSGWMVPWFLYKERGGLRNSQ